MNRAAVLRELIAWGCGGAVAGLALIAVRLLNA